ncbi:MAG TPA: hypothetical protein VJ724_13435, partial [Tahibacter sp.]|nr:hypothetical protein [Tahibacter sp.]
MSGNPSDRETRIRDYLDGRLAGAELEAFELALFHDAKLLDDVETTRALLRGLRALDHQPPLQLQPAPVIADVAPRIAAPGRRVLPLAVSFLL